MIDYLRQALGQAHRSPVLPRSHRVFSCGVSVIENDDLKADGKASKMGMPSVL